MRKYNVFFLQVLKKREIIRMVDKTKSLTQKKQQGDSPAQETL